MFLENPSCEEVPAVPVWQSKWVSWQSDMLYRTAGWSLHSR